MSYRHIKIPQTGDKITIKDNRLQVSDNPILGFVEGDGIGADITKASMRVWNAAVEKAYGGKRKVHWAELYLGEKAAGIYDGDYFPAETLDAIKELVVAIKGPLTTPVGGGFRSLNVSLRQELDLYACVRPVEYFSGVPSPMKKPPASNAMAGSVASMVTSARRRYMVRRLARPAAIGSATSSRMRSPSGIRKKSARYFPCGVRSAA